MRALRRAAGLASLALALAFAGCNAPHHSASPGAADDARHALVRGSVLAGPTCPVMREPPDPACADRPVAGAVLVVRDLAGAEVARVTSAGDGTFSVELAPGTYRLFAQPVAGLMGTPGPIDVAVRAGQPAAEVTVSYDTGIR